MGNWLRDPRIALNVSQNPDLNLPDIPPSYLKTLLLYMKGKTKKTLILKDKGIKEWTISTSSKTVMRIADCAHRCAFYINAAPWKLLFHRFVPQAQLHEISHQNWYPAYRTAPQNWYTEWSWCVMIIQNINAGLSMCTICTSSIIPI